MKTDELREMYLSFFESKGHQRCPSDVMVPTWDPSVLFTPAGMNQFKDHFLGKVKLDFVRATTCQKCLRTGDIDNVGRTAYHQTFFEMLGNFSFGDYFKREAIHWAWEFLTSPRWLGIAADRLSVSIYLDDNEAADIWQQEIGLSPERIERMDEHDNFWPAGAPTDGPDGVCGPCSEIFYHPPGGGPEVEIWNLVFTQFNRVGNPPDNLRPLPSKNIDTGMGLERTVATLQGVDTNFHIDTLRPLVDAAADVCQVAYEPDSDAGRRLRRMADHVRACAMAIHENVYPGPQKEKYVIRRLLRRAVLDGHQLGLRDPFLYQLVPAVVEVMKGPYPELLETTNRVADVIKNEETGFLGTLDDGLARIEHLFSQFRDERRNTVDGAAAADLYQTYGVPPEVFESLAAEQQLAFDWEGFQSAMEAHGEASGRLTHSVMDVKGPEATIKQALHTVEFLGYDTTEAEAELKFIIAGEQLLDRWSTVGPDTPVQLVLDRTPFYGEAGGQVGDSGEISAAGVRFVVTDTDRQGDLLLHRGHLLEGELQTGSRVMAVVDDTRRQAIRRAHSATHILHHALQQNLGTHAQQQGSKVDGDWLRFDFTNLSAVPGEQLATIEAKTVSCIEAAAPITASTVPLAEARQAGAMMLFGEKYPDPVRMVSMGDFSKELCGGTHLENTRDVGAFEITAEEAVSSGVRRVIALTGEKAREHARQTRLALTECAQLLEVDALQTPVAAAGLARTVRDLKKELSGGGQRTISAEDAKIAGASDQEATYAEIKEALRQTARTLNVALFETPARLKTLQAEIETLEKQRQQLVTSGDVSVEGLLEQAQQLADFQLVIAEIPGANPNLLRHLIDRLRKQTSPIAVLLAAPAGDDKVVLVAGLSPELTDRGAHAGKWVSAAAQVVGGGGGGKPDLAQAGGRDPQQLPAALETAREVIQQQLGGS
ncbi:MAG: alanine--tRNA ligase [Planctomycetaceae bacterium]|nr:alanine--tRNA ligase [Planctomycetaceae bacterium]